MTIQDAHTQLNLRIDKIDSAAYDDVLPEELDVYLNLATRRFIKERFEPRSNRFNLGFEQSSKRTQDLQHLISEVEIDTEFSSLKTINDICADVAPLPSDYFLPLRASALVFYNEDGIAYSTVDNKRVPDGTIDQEYCDRISDLNWSQQQQIHSMAVSPFGGTTIKNPLFVIQNNNIYVYTSNSFITDKVRLVYLREPVPCKLSTSTGIDLPNVVHDEVIDIAARMILSDINSLPPAGQQTLSKVE